MYILYVLYSIYMCTCNLDLNISPLPPSCPAAMVDGREVSDTERQFLASWKATRKARRKALHQSTDTHGEHVHSLTPIVSMSTH